MPEVLSLSNEHTDDVPLLLEQMKRLGIAEILDAHYPSHGNWQGLSIGQVAVGWLAYILSEGDHRLSYMQGWAEAHLQTLRAVLSAPVRAEDFSDDRLAVVLDRLGGSTLWVSVEAALMGRTLRVYDLQAERVRIDSTSAKSYVGVDEQGLFQFGHSKDHRPDLPQVKINIAVLDPLGLPVSTTVVSGQCADDPLYVPEIKQVQQTLERHGLLYIGDSKMAALATRAYLVSQGDYYLCPLSEKQLPAHELTALIERADSAEQPLTAVYRDTEEGERHCIAQGYEYTETLRAEVNEQTISWDERRFVVRSLKMAEKQSKALLQRLDRATREIKALTDYKQGKKRFTEFSALQTSVEAVLSTHRVAGLLEVSYHSDTHTRDVRAYRDRPARTETRETLSVATVTINHDALEKAQRRLGWRVYAVYHPPQTLSLEQAVLAYREQFVVERGFGRMKGKALALTPLYLNTDARVIGLIRMLSMGLRVLTVVEFNARQALNAANETLQGLYAGNPKRATPRPTAEALLRAFKGITLSIIQFPDQIQAHLTPLNPLQQRILELLGFPMQIYQHITEYCSEPCLNLAET